MLPLMCHLGAPGTPAQRLSPLEKEGSPAPNFGEARMWQEINLIFPAVPDGHHRNT